MGDRNLGWGGGLREAGCQWRTQLWHGVCVWCGMFMSTCTCGCADAYVCMYVQVYGCVCVNVCVCGGGGRGFKKVVSHDKTQASGQVEWLGAPTTCFFVGPLPLFLPLPLPLFRILMTMSATTATTSTPTPPTMPSCFTVHVVLAAAA